MKCWACGQVAGGQTSTLAGSKVGGLNKDMLLPLLAVLHREGQDEG